MRHVQWLMLLGCVAAGSARDVVTHAADAQERRATVLAPSQIAQVLNQPNDPNPRGPLVAVDGVEVTIRRRTQLDVATRHEQQSEVYHVLEGSATLLTGGTMQKPRKVDDRGN